MLHTEIIAVCSEIHKKRINILCGQNVEFFDVNHFGTPTDCGASLCVISKPQDWGG
jgi:hypothetical protein